MINLYGIGCYLFGLYMGIRIGIDITNGHGFIGRWWKSRAEARDRSEREWSGPGPKCTMRKDCPAIVHFPGCKKTRP